MKLIVDNVRILLDAIKYNLPFVDGIFLLQMNTDQLRMDYTDGGQTIKKKL